MTWHAQGASAAISEIPEIAIIIHICFVVSVALYGFVKLKQIQKKIG